ncbi:hypothetical protein LCGC14_0799590 [marine sediment metagenome]|uniref:TraG P-loop domain-containing protein n=1 Tax=marine sediment metagenome TaxID=412755 RepID=A0A0F9Q9Y2_9ZZZZ
MELITVKQKAGKRYIHEDYRTGSIFPVMAYDSDTGYFINDDKSIGYTFLCQPLFGQDGQVEERLTSFINTDFPAGTIVSIMWFRSPDYTYDLAKMRDLRERTGFYNPLMSDVIKQRSEFLMGGGVEAVDPQLGQLFFDLKVFITVKLPIRNALPDQEEEYLLASYKKKTESALKTIGFRPTELNADGYIRAISSLMNWGPEASWRQGPVKHDKGRPICDQLMDFDKEIVVDKGHLKIGDTYMKALSAKRLPEAFYFGDAMKYAGDLRGGNVSLKQQYAVCCNIYYPDSEKEKHSLERKRGLAVNQAKGPMLTLVPILADKKRGFDVLYDSMADGYRAVKMTYSVLVFGKTEDEVIEASTNAKTIWREQRFTLMDDKFVQLPLYINCLPMMADRDAVADLWRYKTLTAEQAAVLVPIFGEWKGTGTPHVNLISRNGQIMSFSMHDTGSNKNMLICATSGGGKSFFTNELILSYMSEGAQVWCIDVGRSYEKLCEAVNGDFIHFGSGSDISVNPFELVVSVDGSEQTRSKMLSPQEKRAMDSGDVKDEGEEDALVGLLTAMASQNDPLDDVQISVLRQIIAEVWAAKDRTMLVDDIADKCAEHPKEIVQDLATRLHAFTSKGSYGKYFCRPNNVNFNKQLTVLELEELKGRAHLQKVVLFQLIYQIQQEVYLGDRSRKKVVIIDESWDLIQNGGPEVQKFIEHAYRRFRKYGASVLLVTQSIQDMYKSPVGEAIVENSATMALFRHTEEAVDKLKREAKLVLPDGAFQMLKTVHTAPPHYSEVFLKTERGLGVGRLVVNDFQKLLYSTNADEVTAINELKKQGHTVEESINILLRRSGRAA